MRLFDRLRGRDSGEVRHDVTVDLDAPDAVRVTCTCGFLRADLPSKEEGEEVATVHLRESFTL